MMLENKLKQVALLAAVDISLKRMKKSPERCARNLMELGLCAYPDRITGKERSDLFQKLILLCKGGDIQEVRNTFIQTFLEKQVD